MLALNRYSSVFWSAAAWIWTVLAGGGGLLLLLQRGPLPLTNGWFALLSGIAACPLTASLARRYANVEFSGRARLVAAALFYVAGRVALVAGKHIWWL